LIAKDGLDQTDLMERFCRWWRNGENSCTGECFDIGTTTQQALNRFRQTGDPIAGRTDPQSAGNGSLMRLAPVAIYWHSDRAQALDAAREQSVTTHGARAAVEACAFFADLLVDAIHGQPKPTVLGPRSWPEEPAVDSIARGSWHAKLRAQVESSGYVIHTLEAALWSVSRANNFQDAVLIAANLADDADTVAAVTGQLAGALWGAEGIPREWKECLAWSKRILTVANRLLR
jgi:ADP-ribosyl-[dinitrogen reductase] hydrolase